MEQIKRILIIVESPLQLINANEYLKKQREKFECTFLILSSRDENNLLQINKCMKILKLDGEINIVSVKDIDKSKLTRLNFYGKVIRATKVFSEMVYDEVLVGHITSIYQAIFSNTVKSKKYVYMDDGTSSYYEQEVLRKKKIKSFSPWYKRIFPKMVGLSTDIRYNAGGINFFTMYEDLILENHPYLTYDLNAFEYLKKEYGKMMVEKGMIYFIGTPFYWKAKDFNNANQIFTKVSQYYAGKKVMYFPHRYEGQEHLDIVENLGWEIKVTGLPIELSLMSLPNLPEEFGMFTSSAFFTIKELIPAAEFKSFLPDNVQNLQNDVNIKKLYEKYESITDIDVVKLR